MLKGYLGKPLRIIVQIAVLLHALLAGAAPGQQAAGGPPPIVQALLEHYRALETFTADFKQSKELKREGMTLLASGTLRVGMGRALLWEIKEPAPLAVFVDGKRLRLESGSGASATTAVYDLQAAGYSEKMAESLRELTSLLALDYGQMNASYEITVAAQRLDLRPRKPGQFAKVSLFLSAKATISRIEIDELSGDRLLLDFADPKKTDTRWIDSWTARG